MMDNVKLNIEDLRRGGVVALKDNLFSVWVKTACCNLNSVQLRRLADISEKYGRGLVLFSSRQIPIIPFVRLEDVVNVKRDLAEADMELDRCGSRVRNLNVCFEGKICPDAAVNCISLGEKLERFFGSALMYKVKIGAAGCVKDCIISRVLNDISFIGVDANNIKGYDAYVGGRLGVNPFVGVKIAGRLSEDECVNLVQNYLDLLENEGIKGERAADVINRLGEQEIKLRLTANLDKKKNSTSIDCASSSENIKSGKSILKIRATCGEVNSNRIRAIADIAEKHSGGIVHFSVRGAPEIPGINDKSIPAIREELAAASLKPIENRVANMQSCFGNYCLESLADPQGLLHKIESKVSEVDVNLKLTVSASGCPNSCGIAHLSDLGFHGVVEPEFDASNCTGCALCLAVCKRKAIKIENGKAKIEGRECAHCGQCISICPLSAIFEKRKGFAVLLGGRGGKETRLGVKIAEFVTEEKALEITDNLLKLIGKTGLDVEQTIDLLGMEAAAEIITGNYKSETRIPKTQNIEKVGMGS